MSADGRPKESSPTARVSGFNSARPRRGRRAERKIRREKVLPRTCHYKKKGPSPPQKSCWRPDLRGEDDLLVGRGSAG